jgi:hypothetical protein
MILVRYQYPKDPISTAALMTGTEFLATQTDRGIYVNGERVADMGDEIVCDACNSTVKPTDRCALVDGGRRLYCDACAKVYVLPYTL